MAYLQLKYKEKDKNERDDGINSEDTEYTIKDSCGLIEELNNNILKFWEKNKDTIEKEKKIRILCGENEKIRNDDSCEEEIDADDEVSFNSGEEESEKYSDEEIEDYEENNY